MGMWGVEEDDTKGRARLPSTKAYSRGAFLNQNGLESPNLILGLVFQSKWAGKPKP